MAPAAWACDYFQGVIVILVYMALLVTSVMIDQIDEELIDGFLFGVQIALLICDVSESLPTYIEPVGSLPILLLIVPSL